MTRNELTAVAVWTPHGSAGIEGQGCTPSGSVELAVGAAAAVRRLATAAALCSEGHAVNRGGRWVPEGDPLDAAVWGLAQRLRIDVDHLKAGSAPQHVFPFDPHRRRMSVIVNGQLIVQGAPETVLPRCRRTSDAETAVQAFAAEGLRIIAVATK